MKIKALAHRGYPIKYPENTIKSFYESYRLNFSHIELDVQLTKDGIPVLMHDETIDRTTNGTGNVRDYTKKELKEFRTKKGDEEIPTLEEALLFAKGKLKVAVELKQHREDYDGLEKKALEVIQKTDMMDQVYVNSFNHPLIMKLRELSKEIELGFIQSKPSMDVIPQMKELNIKSLAMPTRYLTDHYVSTCEEAGIMVIVWPVDTEEEFLKVAKYGSILSTTNDLEEFKRLTEKYQQ